MTRGRDFEAITHAWVTRAIRAEMVKRGMTFGELAERIVMVGGDENERNLRNKIARGTFSAALFVQCLAAMGCTTLSIDLMDKLFLVTADKRATSRIIYGSSEQREEVVRAVWAALRQNPSESHDQPGMVSVREAVENTDLRPYFSGATSLDEMVQAIRQKMERG